jgi:multicomponent Na+:H+ antiporter subunit D
MSNLIAFVVLIPILTAVALMPLMGRPVASRAISLVSGVILLLFNIMLMTGVARGDIYVSPLGNWPALVGIVWVVDGLSAIMLLLTSITSLATLVYASGSLRAGAESRYFFLLHQFIVAGINGSFITGDFFNLFVFFEIMLLSSFVLIALGGGRIQLNRTFPYVLVNLIASALFLAGLGAIYGTAGTVNMAVLSERVAAGGLPPVFWAAITLLFTVFVIKAAVAPVFFWLPDAYPEAPTPVLAFFAGLLTKVGLYTLFRSVPLVLGPVPGEFHTALLVLASLTMLMGILGALGRSRIKEVMSFQIVSSVGFIVFGLAVYTPMMVAAGVFYMAHSILITTALFFAAGVAERIGGSDQLGSVRGLARTHPWLATGFFVAALALAGLPPLSGFWAKLFLVIGGFSAGAWAGTATILFVSLLTLGLVLRLWTTVFWGAPSGQQEPSAGNDRAMVGATLTLASAAVLLALAVSPLWSYSERVGAELLQVRPYVNAVMNNSPALPVPVALDQQGGSL